MKKNCFGDEVLHLASFSIFGSSVASMNITIDYRKGSTSASAETSISTNPGVGNIRFGA